MKTSVYEEPCLKNTWDENILHSLHACIKHIMLQLHHLQLWIIIEDPVLFACLPVLELSVELLVSSCSYVCILSGNFCVLWLWTDLHLILNHHCAKGFLPRAFAFYLAISKLWC
uniref:Uncharacterized protein n=1 Tax=Opuntia streptacantha TaxID=393608 RepID=A0A7C9EKX3_OPUST